MDVLERPDVGERFCQKVRQVAARALALAKVGPLQVQVTEAPGHGQAACDSRQGVARTSPVVGTNGRVVAALRANQLRL